MQPCFTFRWRSRNHIARWMPHGLCHPASQLQIPLLRRSATAPARVCPGAQGRDYRPQARTQAAEDFTGRKGGRGWKGRGSSRGSGRDRGAGRGRGRGRGTGRGGSRRPRKQLRPQVHMSAPLGPDATVAIIGGGLSGLVCALRCLELGLMPTVFDTGVLLRQCRKLICARTTLCSLDSLQR